MCYTVAYLTKRKITYAKRAGASEQEVKELEAQLEELTSNQPPMFHVSGFVHPQLLCFSREEEPRFDLVCWGLVPHWVKDHVQAATVGRQTLNARGETVLEKPAFREAVHHRCLVLIDGFFEFFHFGKQTYPHFIHLANDAPMALGGIRSRWTDPLSGQVLHTVSIVTTAAVPLMARIHNNPKADGPRMPFILPPELDEAWLSPDTAIDRIPSLIQPYAASDLEAWTVGPLLGKHALPNTERAFERVEYPELALLS